MGVKQTGGKLCMLGNVQEGKQLASAAWKPPDSFIRATTKYWIRPENIVSAASALSFALKGAAASLWRFMQAQTYPCIMRTREAATSVDCTQRGQTDSQYWQILFRREGDHRRAHTGLK